jgi:hypothetical protein
MTKARTLPTIAVTIFLVTLSAAAPKPKPAAGDYFPLQVGDSWTYRNKSGDGEYSLKVLGEEKQADGSTRYHVEMLSGVKIHSWFSKTNECVLLHKESYPDP